LQGWQSAARRNLFSEGLALSWRPPLDIFAFDIFGLDIFALDIFSLDHLGASVPGVENKNFRNAKLSRLSSFGAIGSTAQIAELI
jgi:hypothetical protein